MKIYIKKAIAELNVNQKMIFDYITATKEKASKRIFYIDIPEGAGKTFLQKALIHYFLGIGKKILPIAWTGIASILLPKEVTSHKTFKLPFDLRMQSSHGAKKRLFL